MVAVVPGPEALTNWTLESTKAHIPSSVDSRKFILFLGWRMAQLGERMADTNPIQVIALSGLFHDVSCPINAAFVGLS